MTFAKKRHRAARAATLLAAVWLAGCAALAPEPQTPEDIVLARANARWAAMLKADFTPAYGYLAPGVRALVTENAFAGRYGGQARWTEAEAVKVQCPSATKCLANIKLTAPTPLMRKKGDTVPVYFDETWVLQDGQWWLYANL